jgi:hypothetical protein
MDDAEQAARDLAQSLRVCAKEGDDLAEIELEGQLAQYPWLATDADRETFAWLAEHPTEGEGC